MERRNLRHHRRCVMAQCISVVRSWGGDPESSRALHRLEDLVGDSCATFKVIGKRNDEESERIYIANSQWKGIGWSVMPAQERKYRTVKIQDLESIAGSMNGEWPTP